MNYIESSPLGSALSVSGVLTIDGAPAPGQPVTITRSISGGTPVQVGQATTDSYGVFTISDTPSALGTYTYTASFAGDSATSPDTATGEVTVSDTAQIALQVPSAAVPNQSFGVSGTLSFGSGAPPAETRSPSPALTRTAPPPQPLSRRAPGGRLPSRPNFRRSVPTPTPSATPTAPAWSPRRRRPASR